jgi:hypothetical protein
MSVRQNTSKRTTTIAATTTTIAISARWSSMSSSRFGDPALHSVGVFAADDALVKADIIGSHRQPLGVSWWTT